MCPYPGDYKYRTNTEQKSFPRRTHGKEQAGEAALKALVDNPDVSAGGQERGIQKENTKQKENPPHLFIRHLPVSPFLYKWILVPTLRGD